MIINNLIERLFNLPYQPPDNFRRIFHALKILDNPHLNLPKTIHVAGTNGKGSTIAFIKAIMESDQKIVHTFTSPHLVKFNERIVLSGKMITNDYLQEIILYTFNKLGNILSFPEMITCIGFLAFSNNYADFLLLETGLGGRLDPTNVIKSPVITIITPISIDHVEILGSTVEDIAREKGSIQKHGSLSFIAPQENDKITEILVSMSYSLQEYSIKKTLFGNLLSYKKDKFIIPKPKRMLGEHQIINSSIAASVCLNLGIHKKSIINGIKNAFIPARIQILKNGPLAGAILDGAHNEGGAKVLAQFLMNNKKLGKRNLVIGMMIRKDIRSFLKILAPFFLKAYTVTIPYKGSCPANNFPKDILPIIPTTLDILYNNPPDNLVICGSLYLAGIILETHS